LKERIHERKKKEGRKERRKESMKDRQKKECCGLFVAVASIGKCTS
jgi:hypothetical protein